MDGGSLSVGFHHAHNATDQAANSANANASITLDQESSSLYATLTQRLTPISPNLTASLTGQYQNSTFNGGIANNETDNIYLLGLNLTYQFNHYISGEIGYNYDLLASDLASRSYNRNRIYIGVTATY
jgi:uncharacterized protein (PEP-CTERM system associated)